MHGPRLHTTQAALDARLGSLKSVYGTLRHGVAPSLLTDNPAVGELIDNPVRCWERQLDDGLADADALILRVFTKVQAWLAQWKDTLGVDHVERDGAEPTTSSGILPRERCVRTLPCCPTETRRFSARRRRSPLPASHLHTAAAATTAALSVSGMLPTRVPWRNLDEVELKPRLGQG